MTTRSSNNPTGRESNIGELLQSATTVASIAVGLLVFRSRADLAPAVPLLIFATGSAALYASVLALVELLDEQGESRLRILSITNSIGITFWSILFLAIAYVIIMYPGAGDRVADVLEVIARLLRAH